MPVLVEGATWLARASVLEERFRGGAAAFAALAPPSRRSEDGELVAVSFGSWTESRFRLRAAVDGGLELFRDRAAADVAVVHHRFGAEAWCPWLELAEVGLPTGGRVLAARAAGSARTDVVVPAGWRYESSATFRTGVVELSPADRPLRFVRRDPDAAVYLDRFAGGEVRVHVPDPPRRLTVVTAAGARHELTAEVVRGPRVIELGLMHREHLPEDAGMLFVLAAERMQSFWMKNTLVPLDILFVRREGVVVNVVERAEPMTGAPRLSAAPCSLVLEVNGGWAARRGVGAGDRVVGI